MHVDSAERLPVKIWAEDFEEGALAQAHNLANLPFVFKHVAIMSDGHLGFGMPIGGVLATTNVVVPSAVGYDIGCGVRAWATSVQVEEVLPVRDSIMQQVRSAIPVGFSWHQKPQDDAGLFYDVVGNASFPIISANHDKALLQLGTMGQNNHFVELQKDENDMVWAMVHSGSRNLGKQVADHYNKVAVQLNAKWHSAVPKAWELAFLPLDSEEGQLYMAEMLLCLAFAKLNRQRMMEAVKKAFDHELGARELLTEDIDIHHNYAQLENHFGKNVVVHRKGAVKAIGTVLIPGSMGSHSYIAEGLENPDSFKSCSHGAGRAMGRKAAIRDLPDASQAEEMRERDIKLYGGGRGNEWVAESKLSYKDIDSVMANQADLVQPITKLTPLAVLKA